MNARTMLAAALLLGACAAGNQAKVEAKAPVEDAVAQAARLAKAKADELAAAARAEAERRLPGEEVLDQRAAIPPLAAFEAPVPRQTVLKNGLKVLVVERAGAPIQALSLVVKRGSTSDPKGQAGLASLTAAMLEAGSAKKSQAQIAALADAMGAELRAAAGPDALAVSLSAQPARLKAMAQLLADVALKPNFDPAEWKKVQAQRVAQLTDQLAEPRAAAGNAFAAALYGEGPLGHTPQGTPETVKALKLDDAKKLWAGVDPSEAAIVAVGAASQAQVVELAGALFGGWRSRGGAAQAKAAGKRPAGEKAGAPGAPPAPEGARPRLVLVEFPGRPQTVLRVGQPAAPFASPDALPLRLLNSVLGGSFTSRLNANLREKNGYTYGAGSNFAFGRGPGAFSAAASVKTQVTGAALKEMLFEITRAVEEPLPAADLEKGKALLAYQLVEQLQRAELTAAVVAEMFSAGAELDYLKQFVPRLQALTVADVQAAARRSLDPKTMTITVVGDAGVLGQLEPAGLKLPAPERRAATGAKL